MLREFAGAWRAILGLLVAVLGLLAVPFATTTVIDLVSPASVQGQGQSPSTEPSDDEPPWVPTARGPRTARTTITVEAIRTGIRVTVEHVIELVDDDLLYEAVRSGMIPADEVLSAVVGKVEIRLGDGVDPPSHTRFELDREVGASPRITTVASRNYDEGLDRTAVPEVAFTPRRTQGVAATSTVTVRGVGYALDTVPSGEPDTEQPTSTTFTAPPGRVSVLMVRTAAAAVTQYRYGNADPPAVPSLTPFSRELSFLALLVPWMVFFALRPRPTPSSLPSRPSPAQPGPGVRRPSEGEGAAWMLICVITVAGAGVSVISAVAAAAVPLLLAGWLGESRSWTRRAVRRYLLATATLVALGSALMLPVLSASPWGVLLAGCALGAVSVASGLALMTGRRGWAEVGAVAGTASVLAYVVAWWWSGSSALLVMAAGLLWAPLLVPVWPRRVPRPIRWVLVGAIAVAVFAVPMAENDELRWHLPHPGLASQIPWSVLARLALIGVALHLLWKHAGPVRMPVPAQTAGGVRRRYRAFARAAAAQRAPVVRAAGVALVVAAFAEPRLAVGNAAIAYLLAPVATLVALRPIADDTAERLARVTTRAFNRLLDARARGRLAYRILDRLYHSSPAHLASGDLSLDEFHKLHAEAVANARRGEAGARRLPVLASAAGRWATRNGVAAAVIATGLAAPLVVIEAIELAGSARAGDVLYYLDIGRRLGRWALYGFFFGCFYPSLRGGTPVAKALVLGAALAVPEALLTLFTSTADTPLAVLAAVALRSGQVLAVLLLLGLVWEFRLARIGRVPWSYVRDLRQVGALAAPMTALAVAVASAVVAVLVPELLGTAQPPPINTR